MRHESGRFPGVGGMELYSRRWVPDEPPRAVVVLVHGVGEHSGRYDRLVTPLVDAGVSVYSYDQRGHGMSPGRRVHINSWSEYREDLTTYVGIVGEQEPGAPLVVYGHSMGSLVVLDYLLHRPQGLAGAVISGVALEPAGVGSPFQIKMARTLSGITPAFAVSLGIEAESLTRDPQALAAFRSDPLVTGKATVRWASESLDTVDRIKAGMHGIDLPLLVVHGEDDHLNLVSGALALHDAASSADKTLHTYPGVYHEPHNDLDHELLARDVAQWLGRVAVTTS